MSLTWLSYNLQLWRHGCIFRKFTVRFRPIRKELQSSMHNISVIGHLGYPLQLRDKEVDRQPIRNPNFVLDMINALPAIKLLTTGDKVINSWLPTLYFQATDVDLFWHWGRETLVPNLYPGVLYNNKSDKYTGFISDRNNYLVGISRLRQARVEKGGRLPLYSKKVINIYDWNPVNRLFWLEIRAERIGSGLLPYHVKAEGAL